MACRSAADAPYFWSIWIPIFSCDPQCTQFSRPITLDGAFRDQTSTDDTNWLGSAVCSNGQESHFSMLA